MKYGGRGDDNMTIEVAVLISVVSVSFAIYFGVSNMKRNQTTDDKSEATQLTTVIVKLESIGNGITEIKNEINNVKKDIKEDRERIVKLEVLLESVIKQIYQNGGKVNG